ncbi:hypothetical protein V0288_19855 [Pannus brasiliensis CCIBt3594]|uniref:Uncharacterized protein n=1 Tax=Pannus brasiliensis CCIBt3594 TaxID=1427578 RepID=A0AAW9QXP2_9CHRO
MLDKFRSRENDRTLTEDSGTRSETLSSEARSIDRQKALSAPTPELLATEFDRKV